jgi:hypothetical protein
VRLPSAASTWSRASISARTAPNSAAIKLRKTVVRIDAYPSEVAGPSDFESIALQVIALLAVLTSLFLLIRAYRNRR